VPDSLFPQSLSKFSLVYLLAWYPPLHTSYISSSNHCLLFAAHVHTIATCFAAVPRLCHLILVSLSTLYLELYLVTSHHTSMLPFSSLLGEVPPHFPFLQARSHFHATYCFIHPGSPGQNPRGPENGCMCVCVCAYVCAYVQCNTKPICNMLICPSQKPELGCG